jgi:hypothetical protein
MFRTARTSSTWRAIVAGAAAYALAFNLILAGALAGPIAGTDPDVGASEICLGHGGAADQQNPALPDAGASHCVLCVAGLGAPILPTRTVVAFAFGKSATIAIARVSTVSPPPAPHDPGKPPTGPPLTT